MKGVVLAVLMLATATVADKGRDPDELDRTWKGGLVMVPDGGNSVAEVDAAALDRYASAVPAPRVILYAHGCSGIIHVTQEAGRMFARAGYIFVAPDSFARADKPVSCDPDIPKGGMHRAVLGWRQAEMAHAIAQLRAIPGLEDAPIALVGHSEGATTAATFVGAPLAARVIEGWTCNAGWPEYAGLNAPESEPVLSLVAKRDPWFRLPVLRGDCGEFMDDNDRSVVFGRDDPLYRQHWLSRDPRVQQTILDFLARQM